MQAETDKTYATEQSARDGNAMVLVRGGLLFLFCHALFIGLGMLAYFAD
jgi:hypothetical protein